MSILPLYLTYTLSILPPSRMGHIWVYVFIFVLQLNMCVCYHKNMLTKNLALKDAFLTPHARGKIQLMKILFVLTRMTFMIFKSILPLLIL